MLHRHRHRQSFTLLELIVVMLLLTVAAAIAAPQLKGFFHGRRSTEEVQRIWSLSRAARDLAITKAVPVELWLEADGLDRAYGIEAVAGYGDSIKPLTYTLPDTLQVRAVNAATTVTVPNSRATALAAAKTGDDSGRLSLVWWPDGSVATANADAWEIFDVQDPSAVWYLARQRPLASYILTQEWTP